MGVVKVDGEFHGGDHPIACTLIEHTDRRPVGIQVIADPAFGVGNPQCWSVEIPDAEIIFAMGDTREAALERLDIMLEELKAARDALESIKMPKVTPST
jgi:predicted RNase H-like HicB family nuclease